MNRICFFLLILPFALLPAATARTVLTGAERTGILLPLLQGKRTALVVNQTSTVGNAHLLDTLIASGVQVVKVFAPEHGYRGEADAGEVVKDGKDARTGIPVVSLYGRNKKPAPAQLRDVDIVVFDIQDVGARFYTYVSTLHYVMEACAECRKPLVVADRPNPCDYVDGPVRQEGLKSFVGMHPVPILHGCTMGEMARMIQGEGWLTGGLRCDLTVIPVTGWKHGDAYSLPVKPSPNLPNDQAVALYASLCPFEGTAVSVGRGTPCPFQVIGSPDIRMYSFSFTPKASEGARHPLHEDRLCHGNNLRHASSPKGFTLKYVIDYYQAYKSQGMADRFFTRPEWFDLLIGNRAVRQQIIHGVPEDEIRASWQEELEAYRQVRQKYLLYE